MKTGKGGKTPSGATKSTPAAAKSAASPAAKQAAPAAKTAASAAKPASAKSAAKGAGDDDDPFGIHEATASRAAPLSPRPAKGKTVKFTCPMCETVGFGGAELAGKEVKCCNESCPLPIFTAPKSEGPTSAAQHPMGTTANAPATSSMLPMIATSVLALGVAAGSVWYFVIRDPMAGIQKAAPAPAANSGKQQVVVKVDEPKVVKPVEKTPAEVAAELRSQILPVMVELSRKYERNRSMAFCRRLTAEAYVQAGDIEAAQENLDQLLKVAQKFPYHQVPPLVQLAWRDREQGNANAAQAALDRAVKAAGDLPQESRVTFDGRTDLAALLFVSGRVDEATSLMTGKLLPADSSGQLSAVVRRAELLRSFDINEASVSLPVIRWSAPQWVVTTITLVLRGHSDQALKWCKLAPSPESQAECLAAWGDAIIVGPKSKTATDESIQTAIQAESPAMRARVWARVATARLAIGQKEAAAKSLEQAVAAVKQLPSPNDYVLPDIKELLRQQFVDDPQPRLNAISAAEVARAQALLGQTKPAVESLNFALQQVRGKAPSLYLASNRYEDISRDADRVKAMLKETLDLKTTDQIQQNVTSYRGKLRTLLDAAQMRQLVQLEILKSALDWPLVEGVWSAAIARDQDATPDESREQFLKTALAVRLAARLKAIGRDDAARRCEAVISADGLTDARDTIERETAEAIEKGELAGQAERLGTYQFPTRVRNQVAIEDADWPQLWVMRLATKLAKSGNTEAAFELLSQLPDRQAALWREDGYQLLAGLVAKSPEAADSIWKKYRNSLITVTERVSLFRGLCDGLSTVINAKK